MVQVVLFILSVALATVDGWAVCTPQGVFRQSNPIRCNSYANCGNSCNSYCGAPAFDASAIGGVGWVVSGPCYYNDASGQNVCGNYTDVTQSQCGNGDYWIRGVTCPVSWCNTQCEADSLACLRDGRNWNSAECRCVNCQPFDTTYVDVSCKYDSEAGKYLNLKVTRTCNVDTCGAVNQVICSADSVGYYSLTCDTTCNENSELTCMGSIDGVTIYLRGCRGEVIKCEADGSCDAAIRKVAAGECKNPNSPPNGNNSSSSEQGSSSSGGNAADGLEWIKDSLRVIHETNRDSLGAINHNLENMQPLYRDS